MMMTDTFRLYAHKKTILIIDQDKNNQLLLEVIFRNRDYYNILFASKKSEVYYLLGSEVVIDLVIVEPLHTDMNGFALISHLRKKLKQTPIVILTVCGMAHEKKECFSCGCNAFISKPFKPQSLMDQVEQLLRQESL